MPVYTPKYLYRVNTSAGHIATANIDINGMRYMGPLLHGVFGISQYGSSESVLWQVRHDNVFEIVAHFSGQPVYYYNPGYHVLLSTSGETKFRILRLLTDYMGDIVGVMDSGLVDVGSYSCHGGGGGKTVGIMTPFVSPSGEFFFSNTYSGGSLGGNDLTISPVDSSAIEDSAFGWKAPDDGTRHPTASLKPWDNLGILSQNNKCAQAGPSIMVAATSRNNINVVKCGFISDKISNEQQFCGLNKFEPSAYLGCALDTRDMSLGTPYSVSYVNSRYLNDFIVSYNQGNGHLSGIYGQFPGPLCVSWYITWSGSYNGYGACMDADGYIYFYRGGSIREFYKTTDSVAIDMPIEKLSGPSYAHPINKTDTIRHWK